MSRTYIAYGIGQYYNIVKPKLDERSIHISFLCDRKWIGTGQKFFEGIPIIEKDDIVNIPNAMCIICAIDNIVTKSIASELESLGIPYIHVNELIGIYKNGCITGKILKEQYIDGIYCDNRGNQIFFDHTVPEALRVNFNGEKSILHLGKNLLIGELNIDFGNEGKCTIGDGSEILKGKFSVAYAELSVGKECLFAKDVSIRTHDGHHIFDRNTGERINIPENVTIEDGVWLGEGVKILSGAQIGKGSIVGAGAITSGRFPEGCILAGVPARIIRREVCWKRYETGLSNYRVLEECEENENRYKM